MEKMLIISPFNIFPPYWGGASRIYNLAKYLAKKKKVVILCNYFKQIKKVDIDCKEYQELSSNPNVKLCFVKSLGRGSQLFNPLLVINGLKIIRKEKPDFIMAEFAWSGLHAMILYFLSGISYILDEHNVEFIRFKRMKRGNKLTIFLLKLCEKLSCKFAYKIFCVSEVDRDFLISELKVNKNKVVILPNGVDIDKFYSDEEKKEKIRKNLGVNKNTPLILFYGKLDYKPNYEAVEIIYKEILPKLLKKVPDAKFLIVGDNPPLEFSHESIIFTGMVENIEDYINASNVVICPILSGGGTRIKILEALACGKVIVSTQTGAEGLIGEENNDILKIADDWDKFSKEVIKLVKYPIKDYSLQNFIKKYSWENIIKKLERLDEI